MPGIGLITSSPFIKPFASIEWNYVLITIEADLVIVALN